MTGNYEREEGRRRGEEGGRRDFSYWLDGENRAGLGWLKEWLHDILVVLFSYTSFVDTALILIKMKRRKGASIDCVPFGGEAMRWIGK